MLEVNPAARESLFVEDRNGKVKLDEGAFAEAFVENNHLICYNGIVYDQTGQALSSAEGQQAIYRLLRGLNVTTGFINPFVAGVLSTIGVELLMLVISAIVTAFKK